MFDLSATDVKHLLDCLSTVERGYDKDTVRRGFTLLCQMIEGDVALSSLIAIKNKKEAASSQKSYQLLRKLDLINHQAIRDLPRGFNFTALLYGHIFLNYPYFFVERARHQAEVPSLSGLRLLTFDYEGTPGDEDIEVSFAFIDKRISLPAIDRYIKYSLVLSQSHLTVFQNDELLATLRKQLDYGDIDTSLQQQDTMQLFRIKVDGLEGFYRLLSKLIKLDVSVDLSNPHFVEVLATCVDRELQKAKPDSVLVEKCLAPLISQPEKAIFLVKQYLPKLVKLGLSDLVRQVLSLQQSRHPYEKYDQSDHGVIRYRNFFNPYICQAQTTEFHRYESDKVATSTRSFEI